MRIRGAKLKARAYLKMRRGGRIVSVAVIIAVALQRARYMTLEIISLPAVAS